MSMLDQKRHQDSRKPVDQMHSENKFRRFHKGWENTHLRKEKIAALHIHKVRIGYLNMYL